MIEFKDNFKQMQEKTVLITGATGFLGSHLLRAFLRKGHQVIILKRSFSDTWRINDLLSDLKSYDLDKCTLESVFIDSKNIDTIVHTATCYGKRNETVSEIFETNTLLPLKLLELAIASGVKKFLNTDTYFNKGTIPYQGLPYYSLSKYQFMNWAEQFTLEKKICFINLCLEHPFGLSDDISKFTTYIIKSCLDNVCSLNLTAGEQKRDFIYMEDIVIAYSTLLSLSIDQDNLYQKYELGSGKAISIREFVETVHELTNSRTKINFGFLPYKDNEIMFSQANTEALKQIGWQPKYTLKEGLLKTIDTELAFSRKASRST